MLSVSQALAIMAGQFNFATTRAYLMMLHALCRLKQIPDRMQLDSKMSFFSNIFRCWKEDALRCCKSTSLLCESALK